MDREIMTDSFSAHWFKTIKDCTETPKLETLMLEARDKFLETCTFDELEKETIDLV